MPAVARQQKNWSKITDEELNKAEPEPVRPLLLPPFRRRAARELTLASLRPYTTARRETRPSTTCSSASTPAPTPTPSARCLSRTRRAAVRPHLLTDPLAPPRPRRHDAVDQLGRDRPEANRGQAAGRHGRQEVGVRPGLLEGSIHASFSLCATRSRPAACEFERWRAGQLARGNRLAELQDASGGGREKHRSCGRSPGGYSPP